MFVLVLSWYIILYVPLSNFLISIIRIGVLMSWCQMAASLLIFSETSEEMFTMQNCHLKKVKCYTKVWQFTIVTFPPIQGTWANCKSLARHAQLLKYSRKLPNECTISSTHLSLKSLVCVDSVKCNAAHYHTETWGGNLLSNQHVVTKFFFIFCSHFHPLEMRGEWIGLRESAS